MTYDRKASQFSFDRTRSGIVDFSESFPAITVSPTYEKNGKISLRVFIDRSSIELIGNEGRFVMTNLVFPTQPYSTLSVASSGNAKISNLKIFSVKTK